MADTAVSVATGEEVDVDLRRVQWLRYDDLSSLLRKTGASKQNSAALLKWHADEWAVLRGELVDAERRLAAFLASIKPLSALLDAPDSVASARVRAHFPRRVAHAGATTLSVPAAAPPSESVGLTTSSGHVPPVTPGAELADDDALGASGRGRDVKSSRSSRSRGSGSVPSTALLPPPPPPPPSSGAGSTVPQDAQTPQKQDVRKRRRSEDPATAATSAEIKTEPDTAHTTHTVPKAEPASAHNAPPSPQQQQQQHQHQQQQQQQASMRSASLAGAEAVPLANAAGVPLDLDDTKDLAQAMRKRSAVQPHVRQQYLQRDRDLGDGLMRRKRRGGGEGEGDDDAQLAAASVGVGEDLSMAALQPYGMRDADLARPLPNNINANTFWQAIEPFFAPLTSEIAESLLTTKPTPAEEQHFQLPPLGVAMSQNATAAIKSRSHRPDATEAEMHAEAAAIEYWNTEACQPGELTQRLLAALIDEHELDDARQAALKTREIQNAAVTAAASAAAAAAGDKSDLAPTHPLAVAPVSNYSTDAMLELDARVRQMLRDVALVDEFDPPLHLREDDDLCAELRAVQRSLRERVKTNVNRKMAIAKLVAPKIEQEKKHQLERQHDRATEAALVIKVKAAAKRKKKTVVKKPRSGM